MGFQLKTGGLQIFQKKEDVKDNLEPLLEALSVFAEDDVVDDLRSRIENRLDGLPTKDDIDQGLQNALDQIPSADYVNGKVDELVEQISPIVEELNETEAGN